MTTVALPSEFRERRTAEVDFLSGRRVWVWLFGRSVDVFSGGGGGIWCNGALLRLDRYPGEELSKSTAFFAISTSGPA